MKNIIIIKKYFTLTTIKKRYLFYLIITSLLSDGPYMFTSLLFSYAIKFLTHQQVNEVILVFIGYFLLKIISKIARVMNYHATKLYYNESYNSLQSSLINKLDKLDYDYFTSQKKSQLINTANIDVRELADFGSWLSKSLLLFISFIISIIILWKISFGLMIFGVIVNGLVIYILNRYNDKYEKIMFKAKHKTDNEISLFSQIMNGIAEIKIFDLLLPFKNMYANNNKDYLKEHDSLINNNIIKNIVSPSITMLAEICLMVYAVYHCLNGDFGIETVLIIQSYFGNLFSSLSELISVLGDLRLKKVSIDRYASFVEEQVKPEQILEISSSIIKGEIDFQNVYFSYQQTSILNNFNLHLKPGKIIGLIGQSGSGKSTIMKLILGFINPTSGRVMIDNHDISKINDSSLTKIVSLVNQDPFIFNLSIYDNLALINPNPKAIEEVCKKVHLYDFIMSLPQQFNTILNENATDLSGGQKQRLAIARALLKNTKIILLDEITSALDERLSRDILGFLNDIKKDHIIIMITHRTSEYELCDDIIDLNKKAYSCS